ncbi:MAG: hypothetical protein AAGH15_28400 [Myxococcota bacterium]
MAELNDKIVDKRIVERNIKKGVLSRAEYVKHIETLADAAENAETVSMTGDEAAEDEAAPAEGA